MSGFAVANNLPEILTAAGVFVTALASLIATVRGTRQVKEVKKLVNGHLGHERDRAVQLEHALDDADVAIPLDKRTRNKEDDIPAEKDRRHRKTRP